MWLVLSWGLGMEEDDLVWDLERWLSLQLLADDSVRAWRNVAVWPGGRTKVVCLLEPPTSSQAHLPQGTQAQLSVLVACVERLCVPPSRTQCLVLLQLSKQTPPPDLQMFLEHMFLVVPFPVQSSPVRCATWCHGSECLFLPCLCYYLASSFVLRRWHLRATIKAFMKPCILLSCYASAWFGGRREGCLQVPLQPARSIECCTNCDWK